MTDNQDSKIGDAVQPPTDRPLTAGDWIEWHGGENPVPGQRVDVRFRDGSVDCGDPSDDWDWPWGVSIPDHDVIAYRIARPATSAASEGEGKPEAIAEIIRQWAPETPSSRHLCAEAILAALASPPVSERERELEGAADDLVGVVERIEGAVRHGTWRNESGERLKDTPEWARFYLAVNRARRLTAQPAGEGK